MSCDSWCTGPREADLIEEFFDGPVDHDPCSNERSIIRAKHARTAGSLHLPWNFRTTYENPPYSNMLAWTAWGLEQIAIPYHGQQKELLRLVPVALSAEWMRRAMEGVVVTAAGRRKRQRLRPSIMATVRLTFIDELGRIPESNARFESALLYYGPRHDRFFEVFAPISSINLRAPIDEQVWEIARVAA